MNEQSGSKGEANFVWRCKNCKVFLPSPLPSMQPLIYNRENIRQTSKPRPLRIPRATRRRRSTSSSSTAGAWSSQNSRLRANFWRRGPSPAPSSRASSYRMASGTTTTRSREKKSASQTWSGRFAVHRRAGEDVEDRGMCSLVWRKGATFCLKSA
jgi:hypothetical protein